MFILNPIVAPKIHKEIERKILINDKKNFLSLINWIVSSEKVENVVKDPKMPIIKKYLIKTPDTPLFSKLLAKIPIKNDPKKLIKSVPIGKLGK